MPTGAWFVPFVETGIALSIIYAAAIAVLRRPAAGTFLVTTAIGLLHGFGFSFVLQEILSHDAANLWESLLAFNLGVEIGQVAIVLAIWPLLMMVDRRGARFAHAGRWAVAAPLHRNRAVLGWRARPVALPGGILNYRTAGG